MARRRSDIPANAKADYELSIAARDPYMRLSAAVLMQGIRDAKAGGKAAVAWLAGDDARLYAELLGLDINAYSAWLEQHFKIEVRQ